MSKNNKRKREDENNNGQGKDLDFADYSNNIEDHSQKRQKVTLGDKFEQYTNDGNVAGIETLINQGYDINKTETPVLLIAIGNRDKATTEYLLANNADMYAKDTEAMNAMVWAVESDQKDIAKLLLKEGYELNNEQFNQESHCSVDRAAHNHNYPMLEFLVANGADINIKDECGFTPLHYCVDSKPSDENSSTIEKLISLGATYNGDKSYSPDEIEMLSEIEKRIKKEIIKQDHQETLIESVDIVLVENQDSVDNVGDLPSEVPFN